MDGMRRERQPKSRAPRGGAPPRRSCRRRPRRAGRRWRTARRAAHRSAGRGRRPSGRWRRPGRGSRPPCMTATGSSVTTGGASTTRVSAASRRAAPAQRGDREQGGRREHGPPEQYGDRDRREGAGGGANLHDRDVLCHARPAGGTCASSRYVAASRPAQTRTSKRWRTKSDAASPIAGHRLGALTRRSSASSRASWSPSGARIPVTPCCTTSGISQCLVLTTGMPVAAASMMVTGAPPSQSPSGAVTLGDRNRW